MGVCVRVCVCIRDSKNGQLWLMSITILFPILQRRFIPIINISDYYTMDALLYISIYHLIGYKGIYDTSHVLYTIIPPYI